MIRFRNIQSLKGEIKDFEIASKCSHDIDAQGLTLIPALVDPHVHFRFPGETHKESWRSAAEAAFSSGVTTVFDMPNNQPPCTTVERLIEKRRGIEKMLEEARLPLSFGLYLGATKEYLKEISKAKPYAIGVKLFMGGSTGNLLVDDPVDQEEVFARAAAAGLVVAVHAEDEALLRAARQRLTAPTLSDHAKIRSREAARRAVERAIALADKHRAKLYILHVSTREEIELIRAAKKGGVQLLAETSPHHLHFTESDYERLGNEVLVNPPIRTREDVEALWKALREGVIDTIGSDHAPHTVAEKALDYPKAPSGIAGIEYLLSLLLTGVNQGRLSLERLVQITRSNIASFFDIKLREDWVVLDLKERFQASDEEVRSGCGHTPYRGEIFQGRARYLVADGTLFNLQRQGRLREEVYGKNGC